MLTELAQCESSKCYKFRYHPIHSFADPDTDPPTPLHLKQRMSFFGGPKSAVVEAIGVLAPRLCPFSYSLMSRPFSRSFALSSPEDRCDCGRPFPPQNTHTDAHPDTQHYTPLHATAHTTHRHHVRSYTRLRRTELSGSTLLKKEGVAQLL